MRSRKRSARSPAKRCELPRIWAQAAFRRQRLGGIEQPEVGQVLVGEQGRPAFDEGLRAPAPADPGIDGGGVEPEAVPLHDDHPGQVLGIRLGEGVAHRREAVEARRAGFGGFGFAQHHGQGHAAAPAPQQAGEVVEPFDPEAERGEEVAVPLPERSARLAAGLGPVRADGCAVLQFVEGGQTFVVDPRKRRLQRRQDLREEPERRVAVGLFQHLPAEPFDLAGVGARIDRRRLTRRPAQRRALRVQHDEKHGGRASRLAAFPAFEQRRPSRDAGGPGHGNLDRMCALADEQTGRAEPVVYVRRPRARHELFEESRIVRMVRTVGCPVGCHGFPFVSRCRGNTDAGGLLGLHPFRARFSCLSPVQSASRKTL